jgi:hypothetical protein
MRGIGGGISSNNNKDNKNNTILLDNGYARKAEQFGTDCFKFS